MTGISTLFSTIFRVVLFPFIYVSNFLFPKSELDGLSNPVASKAAVLLRNYLRSLTPNHLLPTLESQWDIGAFSSIQQNALQSHSLIVLYLHSPLHQDSESFCRSFLTSEPFLQAIQGQAVVTTGLSVHSGQGAHLQNVLQVTTFPALVILQPSQSTLTVLAKLQGKDSIQRHFLGTLQTAVQTHQVNLQEQETRRLLQQQSSELRRAQDEEYEAALLADQERERQKELEQIAELEEMERLQKLEQEKLDSIEAARANIRDEATVTTNATTIRFCLPDGTKLTRKFEATQTLSDVRSFLTVHFFDNNIAISNIGLSTNFPRTTYNDDSDGARTLQDAQLAPQAVIMIQDLDA